MENIARAALFVELVDLSHIVRDAGFDHSVVSDGPRETGELPRGPDAAGHDDHEAAEHADAGMGNANEIAHEHAGGAPDARAHDGAGNAGGGAHDEGAPAPPVDVPNGPGGRARP